MCHDVKFHWALIHQAAFISLPEALIQTPILHYPDPSKQYIVYTDTSGNDCAAQLSQEHNGNETSVTFLSHTFTDTQ